MASIINAATSGGLISTADTSGILQLQTAGTTAVTVDASQNVTVVGSLTAAGLSGPHNGTVGATTPSTGAFTSISASTTLAVTGITTLSDDLVVNNAGGVATFNSTNSNGNKLILQDAGVTVGYVGATGTGSFLADSGAIARVSTTTSGAEVTGTLKGTATISVGSATPSASGAGITFPATQSASSDANTLDDYEEGTWTPVMAFNNDTTGITYSTQVGTYEKIGRQVTLRCMVILSNNGSNSGMAKLSGFPFTTASTLNPPACFSIWVDITLSGNYFPSAFPQASNTIAYFRMSDAYMTEAQFTNTANFTMGTTYAI